MVQESKKCFACGHVNTVDATFCSKCGQRLKDPPAAGVASDGAGARASLHEQVAAALETTKDTPPTAKASTPPPPKTRSSMPPKPQRRVRGAKTMVGVGIADSPEIQAALAAAKARARGKSEPSKSAEASSVTEDKRVAPIVNTDVAEEQKRGTRDALKPVEGDLRAGAKSATVIGNADLNAAASKAREVLATQAAKAASETESTKTESTESEVKAEASVTGGAPRAADTKGPSAIDNADLEARVAQSGDAEVSPVAQPEQASAPLAGAMTSSSAPEATSSQAMDEISKTAPKKAKKKKKRKKKSSEQVQESTAKTESSTTEDSPKSKRQRRFSGEAMMSPSAKIPTTHSSLKAASAPTTAADVAEPQVPASTLRSQRKKGAGRSNRTMLGQPMPRLASNRPNATDETPSVPATEAAKRDSERPSFRPRADVVYDETPLPAGLGRRRRGKRKALLLTVLIGSALVAVYALFGITTEAPFEVSVTYGEDGESLRVEVSDAEEGTRVRFRDREEAVSEGVAMFRLESDTLHVGENELSLDLLLPGEEATSHTVVLQVNFQVRTDLEGLHALPSGFDVVIEAIPGSDVFVAGEALELDAEGVGRRTFPMADAEVSADDTVQRRIAYRIELPDDGEAAEGALSVELPATTMRLERPTHYFVTDEERVDVSGAVAPLATVYIDHEPVTVTQSRFHHLVELSDNGVQEIHVMALAPRRAPRVLRVRVKRTSDLSDEAERFDADESVNYAQVREATATFVGRRIAWPAEVVRSERAASGTELLLDACLDRQRCPLWVSYPGTLDVENGQSVRVFGTIAGEQEYSSRGSEQVSRAPRVEALVVLPSRRRHRRRR